MSRKSQSLGQAFERRIIDEAKRLPVWIKIPTARTIDGRPAGKTWLDFFGIAPDGRAITADAKWIGQKATLPKSTLTHAQQAWMEQAYQAQGLVGALVGAVLDGRPQVCVVPWATLREASSVPLSASEDWVSTLLELPRCPR